MLSATPSTTSGRRRRPSSGAPASSRRTARTGPSGEAAATSTSCSVPKTWHCLLETSVPASAGFPQRRGSGQSACRGLLPNVTSGQQVTARTVEAMWRIESAALIAGLTRLTQDIGLAEEYAQDALVTALEQWPRTGVPPNPAGWLMTTAKNRAVDAARRRATHADKLPALHRDVELREQAAAAEQDDAIDDHGGADLLRLVFTACHPSLTLESRVALTLRCLGGLSTAEIARALLAPEATVAQRIVRAKNTLRGIPIELPPAAEWPQRLSAVLEVVYLVFNEGYAATAGEDWTRPGLCAEALRLGRVLTGLLPDQPEVHGLLALM